MADQRISQLPLVTTLNGSETAAGLQSGANVQIPVTAISQYVSAQVLSSQNSSTYVDEVLSSTNCGIIIPYYFYTNSPYSDPTFTSMVALIRQYHEVPTIVVLNQPGGSGTGGPGPYDLNYADAIRLLKAAGAIVLGYVDSGLGTRAASAVEADILLWTSLYPSPAPDGIFLDNAPYDPGTGNANVLLFQSYYNFCHTNGYSFVCVNPGSNQQQAWYDTKVADLMLTWENSSWPNVSDMAGNFVGGHGDYDWKQNGLLVYNQSSLATETLYSMLPYVRWVYSSSANLPNPWSSLPGYIGGLYKSVQNYNVAKTDGLNVKDFGAKLDGVTDDSTAFQAAYSAAPANGTIVVPNGGFIANGPTRGDGNNVLWEFNGNTYNTSTLPVQYFGDGDVLEGMVGGRKGFYKSLTTSQSGYATLEVGTINNNPSITGVVTSLQVNAQSKAGCGGYTWPLSVTVNSGATGGVSNQDVAIASTVRRTGAGATWQYFGQTIDTTGVAPNSPSANVGFEMNIGANGPEVSTTAYNPVNGARAGFNFVNPSYQPPARQATHAYTVGAVVQPASPNGYVYVCTVAGTTGSSTPTYPTTVNSTVVDGTVTWKCGTTLNQQIARGFSITDDGTTQYGAGWYTTSAFYDAIMEFSGASLISQYSSSPAAIRLASNMPIDFSGNLTLAGQNLHTLKYNSGSTRLEYDISGSPAFTITDFSPTGKWLDVSYSSGSNAIVLTAQNSANISLQGSGAGGVIISGGSINGTQIGNTSPATATVTALGAAIGTHTGTSYTVASSDFSLILNPSGAFTLTLPTASSNTGRVLWLKLIAAFAVTSASSNVVPLAGGAAGTAILTGTAGKYAMLQSDGSAWQIMGAN